ncbi:hypothetical protein [Streptomyces sp. NPDC059072]
MSAGSTVTAISGTITIFAVLTGPATVWSTETIGPTAGGPASRRWGAC